jgi:hypothetical protein
MEKEYRKEEQIIEEKNQKASPSLCMHETDNETKE